MHNTTLKKSFFFFYNILLLALLLLGQPLYCQELSHIDFKAEDQQIEIRYDLKGNGSFSLSLYYSLDGYNWQSVPNNACSGAIGDNIQAGMGLQLVWRPLEHLGQLEGNLSVKLKALYNTPVISDDDKPDLKKAINYSDMQFLFSETQARGMKIVAKYPLSIDAYPDYTASNLKKELEFHRFIQFDKKSAYISGNYSKGNGIDDEIIGTSDLPYELLDINNFAISLNFKINTQNKAMPILYIGQLCRRIGIEISNTNTLFCTFDNTQKKVSSTATVKANSWNELLLVYTKKNISLYLNREPILNYSYTFSDCLSKYEKSGVKIVSANYANGSAFKGYWKEFNIYTLAY